MNILVIAPHQDDEILGVGGLMQICRQYGNIVRVIFVTNGDYHGVDIARQRYYESRDALAQLDISESHIYYMGYGDTGGMSPGHSFLQRLLTVPLDEPLITPTASKTYHPAGRKTVRVFRTGQNTALTRRALLSDLAWCMTVCSPDLLVLPSPLDAHGDHAAIAALVETVYGNMEVPPCLFYLIHGGDDSKWPPRTKGILTRPPRISSSLWKLRISLPLTTQQKIFKRDLIGIFSTQLSKDHDGFLYSFAQDEEIFFSTQAISPQDKCTHSTDMGSS